MPTKNSTNTPMRNPSNDVKNNNQHNIATARSNTQNEIATPNRHQQQQQQTKCGPNNSTPSTMRTPPFHQQQHQYASYAAAASSPIPYKSPASTATPTLTPTPPTKTAPTTTPQPPPPPPGLSSGGGGGSASAGARQNQQYNQPYRPKSKSPVRGGEGFGVFDNPTRNNARSGPTYQMRQKSKSPTRPSPGDQHSHHNLQPYADFGPHFNNNNNKSPGAAVYNERRYTRSPYRGRNQTSSNDNSYNTNRSSRSPVPRDHHQHHSHPPPHPRNPTVVGAADMTVLVTRTDLVDSSNSNATGGTVPTEHESTSLSSSPVPSGYYCFYHSNTPQKQQHPNHSSNQQLTPEIAEYSFNRSASLQIPSNSKGSDLNHHPSVAICRVPPCPLPQIQKRDDEQHHNEQAPPGSASNTNIEHPPSLVPSEIENNKQNSTNEREFEHNETSQDDNIPLDFFDKLPKAINSSDPTAMSTKRSHSPSSTTVPPTFANPELMKYWNQRHRLFSRFDHGIELDDEGWFSVTPEQIADHVAHRMVELVQYNTTNDVSKDENHNITNKVTVLDAFCGCGGNAIAFAKLEQVEKVICIDLDRSKLQRAANNASIYDIPGDKIVFVECNALFVMQHCYRDGHFVLDEPLTTPEAAMTLMAAMPPPVPTERFKTFQIGGIDLLPRSIDVVFLDPPWGGVDYAIFGKNGYDLQKNMKIQRPAGPPPPTESGAGLNGFFDTFQTQPRNKQERKAQFNSQVDDDNCANGAELLALAASATSRYRQVIYDVPRNTNRVSIGQSALDAGYNGNIKVEEHYLNGRLKTITAYFGCDWREKLVPPASSLASTPARTSHQLQPLDHHPIGDRSTDGGGIGYSHILQPEFDHLTVSGNHPDGAAIAPILLPPPPTELSTAALVPPATTTVFLPFLPEPRDHPTIDR